MSATGQATFTEAVTVPLAQATITGGLLGLTTGAVAALLGAEQPGVVGLAVGALTATGAWLGLRAAWENRLEAVLKIQQPAQAVEYAQSVKVVVTSDDGRRGDFVTLPVDPERLQKFAQGLSEGKPLTTRLWAGGRALFTGAEFEALREELIRRNLAAWRSPHENRAGATLTPQGRAVMRYLAKEHPSPTGLPMLVKRENSR